MYLFKISVTLTLSICFINAFVLYKSLNTNDFFLKELNNTVGSFHVSEIKWIEQPLDHFNENETRTFDMRYFEQLRFWKRGGPIYLFINGEAKGNDVFLKTGLLYELAKETKGAMYASEHRYYGKSKPFSVLTTENLAYLTSRQALADIATLLKKIKMLPQFNESKVVVVGGSYSGNLAAWLKLLYPELVDAAIASSAPVVPKKDFYEYLERVSDDFEQYGSSGCHDMIREIFERYDQLFQTNAGIRQLIEEEQICNDIDLANPENKQLFFLDKALIFMYEAQYGNPESIKNLCNEMKTTSRFFSSKNKKSELWSMKNNCLNYEFYDMIESTKKVDWVMAWTYQTCTEFGYFMTTSSKEHPFTDNISVDFFITMCTKLYGDEFNEEKVDEGIQTTNNMYGSLKPNVTNVIFVNGELDPWATLGIVEDVAYDAPAKLISQSSHCRDLFANKPNDPEELKEAREYIKYLIKKWIGEGEYKKN